MKKIIIILLAVLQCVTLAAQEPRRVKTVSVKDGAKAPYVYTFSYNADGSLAKISSRDNAIIFSSEGNEMTVVTDLKKYGKTSEKWVADSSKSTISCRRDWQNGSNDYTIIRFNVAGNKIVRENSYSSFFKKWETYNRWDWNAAGNLVSITDSANWPYKAKYGVKKYICPSVDVLTFIIAQHVDAFATLQNFIDWVHHAPAGMELKPMTLLPTYISSGNEMTFTLWTLDAKGYIKSVKTRQVYGADENSRPFIVTYTVTYED